MTLETLKTQISIGSYVNYSSENYGVNALRISVGRLTLWFSYKTVIAFQNGFESIVVSENCWSTTTGKHLNAIDNGNKKERLSREEFEKELQEVLGKYKLGF